MDPVGISNFKSLKTCVGVEIFEIANADCSRRCNGVLLRLGWPSNWVSLLKLQRNSIVGWLCQGAIVLY